MGARYGRIAVVVTSRLLQIASTEEKMAATPAIPQEFFTLQSMLTLTGASGATFLVCNGLQRAFDVNPRWLALVVAEALAIFGTYVSHKPAAEPTDYFVAVINGFLIYATAAGGTSIAGGSQPQVINRGVTKSAAAPGRPKRRFLSPWF
jgi:hypothetical protein